MNRAAGHEPVKFLRPGGVVLANENPDEFEWFVLHLALTFTLIQESDERSDRIGERPASSLRSRRS